MRGTLFQKFTIHYTHPWTKQTLINNRVIQSEPRVGGNTKPLLQSNNPQPVVARMIERLFWALRGSFRIKRTSRHRPE